MSTSTSDLDDAEHPDRLPAILRQAADRARDAAVELSAAWQDTGAGRPWMLAARELDRCADRIEKALIRGA